MTESSFFCYHTGFIIIYSNPGPTPSFITTQIDFPTGKASAVGSKKADFSCFFPFFTRQGKKANSLSVLGDVIGLPCFFF